MSLSTKTRSTARWVARVGGWLVIALVVLELCARTEDRIRYGAPFWGNYSLDSLYTYDGLGKWGKPNSSYLKWHLNDLGYRGPALHPGADRIICIGSSETFGLYESYRHEWPRQLELILNQRAGARQFEVVDVAFPGMSVGTAVTRLPQVLSTLSPHIAVIYPSFTPYIDRDKPEPWPPAPAGPAPAQHEHFEPRLAGKVQTMLKADLPQAVQNWIRTEQLKRAASHTTVLDRLPDQNVQAFQQDLDTLTTQLQQHGVQVILVTHATRFGKNLSAEDRDFLTSWRKFFPTLTEQGLLEMEHRMNGVVEQEGQQRGVMVVDAADQIAPGDKNFAEFVHFTDAGAHALATLVANAVDSEPATVPVHSAAIPTERNSTDQ